MTPNLATVPAIGEYVFDDPLVAIVYDRFENGEHRYHAIGMVGHACLLLVHIHPDPSHDDWRRQSASGRLPEMNADNMKKGSSIKRKALPPELQAQLDVLDGNPDTVSVPEAPAANWAEARCFYRVRKEPISIRIDADVLDWLRTRHERYQVEINRILRERMEAEAG